MRAGSIFPTPPPGSGFTHAPGRNPARRFPGADENQRLRARPAIKVPRSRVHDIVLGRRGITADTAFRLARYFGTKPDFWINLQARYDLDAAERKLRRRIEREVRPRAA
jgi:addiction module HigA family antidote